ncbi:MAG: class I SAM-dependent methyltransferase [Bacteroidota bacterium]
MQEDPYKVTFLTWNKIASIYQDKFMDIELYNDTYDLFCECLRKGNQDILEIGCGPGNITKFILDKLPDAHIEAIDMAPNMIELAKKNNPKAHFSVMDCRNIDQLQNKYDGILCGFCMPYLSLEDCSKLIKVSAFLLQTDGILYFSTIEGNYNLSGYETGSTGDRCYVYYYTTEFLQELLNKNGFETIHIIKKNYQKTSDMVSAHLVFIAKKSGLVI